MVVKEHLPALRAIKSPDCQVSQLYYIYDVDVVDVLRWMFHQRL